MSTWSDGYVTDIAYEWFFFHEMAPAHLDFACLLKGHRPPGRGGSFTYLELGAGMGLTSTMLAATNPTGSFWGVDVNPTHVASAEALAEESAIDNVSFIEAGFEELAQHDLPGFDYIVLHGVWSWVSDATRSIILDVIRTRLKPGGVVYVSYNCAVGWGPVQRFGHLLRTMVRLEHGSVENRLRTAIERLTALSQQEGGFFEGRPAAQAWLAQLSSHSPNYLAHEYLTPHWSAFYFAEVQRDLERAKLTFVGAANVLRNFDFYTLKEESRRQAEEFGDLALLETLKDLDTTAGLRKDVFMRGAQASTPEQTLNMLKDVRFALVVGPEDPSCPVLNTSLGATAMAPEILGPMLAALRERPHSLQELTTLMAGQPDCGLLDMLVMCTVLTDGRYIAPISRHPVDGARTTAAALNRVIARRTLEGVPIRCLAAPEIASGLASGDWERYCYSILDAEQGEGTLDPDVLHRRVAGALAERGRVLQDERGAPLDDAGLAELAVRFTRETRAIWNALGII